MQKAPLEPDSFHPITHSAAGSFRKSFSYTLQPTVWPPPLSDSHLESNLAVAIIYIYLGTYNCNRQVAFKGESLREEVAKRLV